jgi:hypothetical protein
MTPVPPLEGSARPFSARRSSACSVSFTVMPTRGWQSLPTSFSCEHKKTRRGRATGQPVPRIRCSACIAPWIAHLGEDSQAHTDVDTVTDIGQRLLGRATN